MGKIVLRNQHNEIINNLLRTAHLALLLVTAKRSKTH